MYNLEKEQKILALLDKSEDSEEVATKSIKIPAKIIATFNQNLLKACEIHEESTRRSWIKASQFCAGK